MKNILVVEDDQATRLFLTATLKTAGFRVTAAPDGAAALKKLRAGSFDLLLTDIWMPKMNGLELLARLRNEPAKAKVVVMTSDDTPETLLRAVREQAYQYLTKPVDPKALIMLVTDALAAKPEAPPIEVISARPDWVELLVPCDLPTAQRIQAFMEKLKTGLSPEAQESVAMAFRELLSNAVEWGGKLDPNRKVRIAYLRFEKMLIYRIADPGPGFRLAELKHAAVSNPEDQPFKHMETRDELGLRPGGLGILMTRNLVDELIYNEAGNEVVFVKYL